MKTKNSSLPTRDEAKRLADIMRTWDLWNEWGAAIDDLNDVYTSRQTMSEEEAREHLLVVQAKILVRLVAEGLATDNVDAGKKVSCIQALRYIEAGRNVGPTYQYLLSTED